MALTRLLRPHYSLHKYIERAERSDYIKMEYMWYVNVNGAQQNT